jgi:transketolase
MTNQPTSNTATRDGFGEAIVGLAHRDPRVLALTGDLTESVRLTRFKKEFPERFWNVGITEQHMVSFAAGLAMEGFVPFVATYAVFMGRAWDQIRVSVCFNKANVKLVATHAGVTVGADGGTAQGLEDISMLRALPNLTIVCPCDAIEAKKATIALGEMDGPAYLRLTRSPSPIITTESSPFLLGRCEELVRGDDVVIFACGPIVATAVELAKRMREEKKGNIRVVNVHTIVPLDTHAIVEHAKETGAVVVAEEHQIVGGLAGVIAETLALHHPTPMEQVGMPNRFGESGEPQELLTLFKMDEEAIEKAIKRVLKRKLFHKKNE